MKSTHLIINNATTTFNTHFSNFLDFSHSPAAITLNHVITIIITAKKNANALIAERITKNTDFFHIRDCVTQPIPSCAQTVNLSPNTPKLKTSQNNRFAP
jgi:hypothetical protein